MNGAAINTPSASALPHVLVVDDDREIRALLSDYLHKHQLRATMVSDGKAMRRVLNANHVDLVVLDIMLPEEDGLSLCRQLRADSRIPIIMLSARGEEIDRIVGLEIGADDYLAKPFNPRELLVRIRGLLRRAEESIRGAQAHAGRIFRFQGWTLDTVARDLLAASGERVALSGAEFRLLAVMVANPNRVLSRTKLMELSRGRDSDPFDRSIDVCVSRLRQIFGDNAREPVLIKTVYGEGYVLAVNVEIIE